MYHILAKKSIAKPKNKKQLSNRSCFIALMFLCFNALIN